MKQSITGNQKQHSNGVQFLDCRERTLVTILGYAIKSGLFLAASSGALWSTPRTRAHTHITLQTNYLSGD